MTQRHLVLAGAGHAQLDLLAALTRARRDGWRVSMVTPQPAFHYSGMLPALIAGSVAPADAQIPVARIARAAGITVHESPVVALDVSRRSLTLADGSLLAWDLLSLDVGSAPAGTSVPGVAEHAFTMRPFAGAAALMARLDDALRTLPRSTAAEVVVVGGGAAGVEIAFALRQRVARAGHRPAVTIVDAGAADGLPLAGFPLRSRRLAGRALRERGVTVVCGTVAAVRHDRVTISRDGKAACDLPSLATAWVSGPAAHPWLADSGLSCDASGYPLAASTLALTHDASAFGAGDCVTLRDAIGTPKAGVYAVRMAPVLAANVMAIVAGGEPRARYTPQSGFLALLSTGDGAALLNWKGLALESRWAQRLKTWIDERYLERYRALAPAPSPATSRAASIPPPPGLP